jgi:Ethanolamine utilization protein EutJ (predicted chaperonin)
MKKRQMEDTKLTTGLKDQELAEIVHRLVAAYQPERIYLFGSKARGDSGGDTFESRLHLRASLPHTVVSEGTLLYEARSR